MLNKLKSIPVEDLIKILSLLPKDIKISFDPDIIDGELTDMDLDIVVEDAGHDYNIGYVSVPNLEEELFSFTLFIQKRKAGHTDYINEKIEELYNVGTRIMQDASVKCNVIR